MSEGELMELAGQKDQLTTEAQTALATELANRGITEDALKPESSDESPDAPSEPADYLRSGLFGAEAPETPSTDLVAVFSAESEAEAKAVQLSLGCAGIESQLQIVVLVAEKKAEEAIKIVSSKVEDL